MISKIWKIKFEKKIIEWLIFRYFNIYNFVISKYQSFYISSFQILTPPPPPRRSPSEKHLIYNVEKYWFNE